MKSYLAAFLMVNLTAAIVVPAPAMAQRVRSFEQLHLIVRTGDTITVTDSGGNSTKGKVEKLTGASLRLKTNGGVRDFAQKDVVEVKQRRRDSLQDGAKRGFFVGAGIGFVAGFAAASFSTNNEAPLAGAMAGAVYGTGIGVVIDALNKSNQTIYRVSSTAAQTRVRVAPLASRARKGVALTLSF